MKKVMSIIGLLGLLVLAISIASAFGVGGGYSKEVPMRLYPGQTVTTDIGLANSGTGAVNMTMKGKMVSDGEGIASFVHEDPSYFVPAGSGNSVPIKLTIPSDASLGRIYHVGVSFDDVSENAQGGMVTIAGAVGYSFDVLIVEQDKDSFYVAPIVTPATPAIVPAKSNNTLIYVIIAIIVIIAVTYFLARKK